MSYIKYKKCYFSGCNNNSGNAANIRFFSFKRKNIREWIKACNNEDLNCFSLNYISKHFFVCSKHFDKPDYSYVLSPFKSKLKNDAVPGLMPTRPKTQIDKVRDRPNATETLGLRLVSTDTTETNHSTDSTSFPEPEPSTSKVDCSKIETNKQLSCTAPEQQKDGNGKNSRKRKMDSSYNPEEHEEEEVASNLGIFPNIEDNINQPSNSKCRKKLFPIISHAKNKRPKLMIKKAHKNKPKLKIKPAKNMSTSEEIRNIKSKTNVFVTLIVEHMVKASKNPKCRYDPKLKLYSLMLYLMSSKTSYIMLRPLLSLPSLSTLYNMVKNFTLKVGINNLLITLIKYKLNVNSLNKYCFILMDEMSIKSTIQYDKKKDKIVGLEGRKNGKQTNIASSALVFMLKGVITKWKHPIGYFLSAGPANSEDLKELIKDAIEKVEAHGFVVWGITSDQGSNFEKCFRELGCSPDNPTIKITKQVDTSHIDKQRTVEENVLQLGDEISALEFPPDLLNTKNDLIQATAYLCGFIIFKFNIYHIRKTSKTIKDCEMCKTLIAKNVDLSLHLYNSFKEYDSDSNNNKLNYASDNFILNVIQWEEIFHYIISCNTNISSIKDTMKKLIYLNLPLPLLCENFLIDFIIDLFLRTRLFSYIRVFKDNEKKKDFTEKIKKIKGT